MKRIVADPTKCMACRACEFACALAHADSDDMVQAIFEQGARPRIYIESAAGLAVPLQCRHCEDAPCVRVCPTSAVAARRDGACARRPREMYRLRFCVQACPFGVIRLEPEGKVVIKCDVCVNRQAQGLEPACVAACPVAALSLEDVDESAKRARARAAAEVAAAYVAQPRR